MYKTLPSRAPVLPAGPGVPAEPKPPEIDVSDLGLRNYAARTDFYCLVTEDDIWDTLLVFFELLSHFLPNDFLLLSLFSLFLFIYICTQRWVLTSNIYFVTFTWAHFWGN